VEYGSQLQALYSTHHYEKMIDNIGHSSAYWVHYRISEFRVKVLSSCNSCCSIAAVQRPEM